MTVRSLVKFVLTAYVVVLVGLICLGAVVAHAAPLKPLSCQPAPTGSGTYATRVPNVPPGKGEVYYYHCDNGLRWEIQFVYRLHGFPVVVPDLTGLKTASEIYSAIWNANATLSAADPQAAYLIDLAKQHAALPGNSPAPIQFVVAKNGTQPTRPTFPHDAAKRSTKASATRAQVGAPCDTRVAAFLESGGVYASVAPGLVALCSRVK